MAGHYAVDGKISINRGKPWLGRDGIRAMASRFDADVPHIHINCDGIRQRGDLVICLLTFTGHHSGIKNPLRIVGCKKWHLDAEGKVAALRGWYDRADHARQATGG